MTAVMSLHIFLKTGGEKFRVLILDLAKSALEDHGSAAHLQVCRSRPIVLNQRQPCVWQKSDTLELLVQFTLRHETLRCPGELGERESIAGCGSSVSRDSGLGKREDKHGAATP